MNNQKIPNTGYVVHTMIAAKWAVGSSQSFDEAVLKAVNLGGDADTIGAVAGQIAGAIWGLSSIRQSWLDTLYDYDNLLILATKLFEMQD
jgi:ADP-ribosyl-[dinitrogen reductase] hydrolase